MYMTHDRWPSGDIKLSIVRDEHGPVPIEFAIMGEFGAKNPDIAIVDLHVGQHVDWTVVGERKSGDHVESLGVACVDHCSRSDFWHEVEPVCQPISTRLVFGMSFRIGLLRLLLEQCDVLVTEREWLLRGLGVDGSGVDMSR
jgi:hypothetical protein